MMKFLDILTAVDFQCPGNALKFLKNCRGVVSLLLPHLFMSMSLKLKHCHLSPHQGDCWHFGIHPSQSGTSPVIPDVQPPSGPRWKAQCRKRAFSKGWWARTWPAVSGFTALQARAAMNLRDGAKPGWCGRETGEDRLTKAGSCCAISRAQILPGSTENKRTLSFCLHFLGIQPPAGAPGQEIVVGEGLKYGFWN